MSIEVSEEEEEAESIHDRVADLERQNNELRSLIQAQSRQLRSLRELLIGCDRELVETEVEARPNVLDNLDDVENLAQTAIDVAKTTHDIEDNTKKGAVKERAKTHLVKEAALSSRGTAQVDMAKVKELGDPDYRVYNTEATRILHELNDDWECFQFQQGTGERSGPNDRVVVDADDIPESLARGVSRMLPDEELSNTVVIEILGKGAAQE